MPSLRNLEGFLQFSAACTKKEDRLHGTFQLKAGILHKLECRCFFKPLVDEVTDSYLEGIDIHIPQEIQIPNARITPGNNNVKALVLMGTADLKAHAEMCLHAGIGSNGTSK